MYKWRESSTSITCTCIVALQCVAGVTEADGSATSGVGGAAVSITALTSTCIGWRRCQRNNIYDNFSHFPGHIM